MAPPSKTNERKACRKEEATPKAEVCAESTPGTDAYAEVNLETDAYTAEVLHSIELPEAPPPPKRPFWEKLLIAAIILLTCGVSAGIGYVEYMLGKINRLEDMTVTVAEEVLEEELSGDADSLTEAPGTKIIDPEEINLRLASQILKDKDVLNILLIGQDTQENVSGTRSDSMILVTVRQKEKEIVLTSFMRDLYVDIPGYKANRINVAYTLGGTQLLDETIQQNFGIHIDGNIAVDFTGFADCIDILGGVDMELTASEAGAINKELFKKQPSIISGTDPQADRWALVGGMRHLTGKEALQYARIREIDSDFNRTSRQRKLLSALFEKVKTMDLKTMNALLGEALPLLTTDLPNQKLIGYGAGILLMQPVSIRTDRIPADGTFQEAVVRRMQVLVPDLEANQLHLKESLYESGGGTKEDLPKD